MLRGGFVMANHYVLFIRPEGSPGPIRKQSYGAEDSLDVRDLATRVTVKVRAHEISPYRHTLFLDGKAYQIVNVMRQH
jgi:hypothetical protein